MAFDPKAFRARLKPDEQKIFDELKRNIREDWGGLADNVRTGSGKPQWSDDRAIMEVIKNNLLGRSRPPAAAPPTEPEDGKKNEGSTITPTKNADTLVGVVGNTKMFTAALKRAQMGLRHGLGKREGSNLQTPLAGVEKIY